MINKRLFLAGLTTGLLSLSAAFPAMAGSCVADDTGSSSTNAPKVDIMKGLTEAQKKEEEENVAALPEEKRRGHHGKTN